MKWLILGLASLGAALTATPATAAPAESLVCTGRRTAPDRDGEMTTQTVSFRIVIDEKARRLTEDGKVMVIRDWSSRRIVYSDYNPGILGALAGGVVTTLERRTGAWRTRWGSGSCKAAVDARR